MMNEVVREASKCINKTQDEWFMDIIVKHCSNEYEGKELNGFDLVFLQDQFDLKVERKDNRTEVRVRGKLVGYWYTDYVYSNKGTSVIYSIDNWIL